MQFTNKKAFKLCTLKMKQSIALNSTASYNVSKQDFILRSAKTMKLTKPSRVKSLQNVNNTQHSTEVEVYCEHSRNRDTLYLHISSDLSQQNSIPFSDCPIDKDIPGSYTNWKCQQEANWAHRQQLGNASLSQLQKRPRFRLCKISKSLLVRVPLYRFCLSSTEDKWVKICPDLRGERLGSSRRRDASDTSVILFLYRSIYRACRRTITKLQILKA